ncbi:pre-toxin TG domain-containing protein [Fusobacterium hwasookii]|uniref:pre-toxin TG domain-containing protein n=2 Tax=Fusobacterium hwasookii TaxID=1583098 RepID=UPI0009C18FBA|nr:pre-toxin TG domain-containing protein [Fusobacterium hwasookii]
MDEINDIGNVIANTIDNKGEDKRNFFGILRAQRGATDLYNISGDSLNLLNEAYKSNKIGADEYKEGLRNIIEATGNDLGLNVSLVYLDTSTMPKDSEGSTGSFYIVDRKNRKVLIPIDVNKIEDIKELLGTLTEEVAHGKDALEGRQDKKVAEDKSNDEEGLETLGRPANEYVKKKFGEDNNSKISLTTDGIDLSNADVGEKVGDYLPKHEIDAAGGVEKVLTPTTNEKIFKVVRLKSNQEVAVEFYQGATNKSLWSTIYDATPGLGDAKGVIEGLTGEDAITGEKLNMFQRIIGGLPAIGRVADAFVTINKPIKKGADYIINYFISDASKGISKLDNVNDTAKLATVAEGVGKNVKK